MRAGEVVLATGAHERPLVFAHNDRPGILLAESLRAYVNRYGVAPGDTVKVTTRRGSIELTARSDLGIQQGTIFIPFAYVEAAANILTNPQLDPIGKIPEYKYCAVRIERARGGEERAVPEPDINVTAVGL